MTVLIDRTAGSREREKQCLEGYRTRVVDGLILCPRAVGADDLTKRCDHTPMVLLGERDTVLSDTVAVDSRDVSRVAIEHLIAAGRRRIAVVGFGALDPGDAMPGRRLEGAVATLQAAGLPTDLVTQYPFGPLMILGAVIAVLTV